MQLRKVYGDIEMAKYSEDTLNSWTKPPSDSEQSKLENSEKMVRDVIKPDEKLKYKSTEVFAQGSYANNTNVRLNSDIDINVRYTGGFFFELPHNYEEKDFGLDKIPDSEYKFAEFKNDVENALIKRFGRYDVDRKDKCITIKGNSYRIETDVVPTCNYRRYTTNGNFIIGAKFISDKGKGIVNFPKQHIENGISKNSLTYRKFKRLARLHKKLRYKMENDKLNVSENIKSFLLESLVWNVPNSVINTSGSWTETLKQSIIFLYQNTEENDLCKDWGEVSELLYLFHNGRKWSRSDVNQYMKVLWNYMEY